jgi:hypothetical protein
MSQPGRISSKLRIAALLALFLLSPATAFSEAQTFQSPEAATDAVVAALEARDRAALITVFGSGDDAADRKAWSEFLASYRAMARLAVDGDTAVLYVGRDQWPFPAPLVRNAAGWRFDAPAAREEVRLRRIGENELDVIEVMRRYVRAQAAYRGGDPDGDGLRTFAAGVLSTPGTRDGLYWPDEPGAPESPIGDFMARAAADGYSIDGQDADPSPYRGYYFRVLQRQGPAAPGGAFDYMVGGHMLAGHALLAFPADYAASGIMSFLVGENGIVYESDLGEDTLAVAHTIDAFDPGSGWSPVADEAE